MHTDITLVAIVTVVLTFLLGLAVAYAVGDSDDWPDNMAV